MPFVEVAITDSHALLSCGVAFLVAFVLGNRPEIRRVVVEGHTCDCPSWGYSNQELSEARARTVREYLERTGGVAAERLRSAGFGEERPCVPNTTRQNKASNRRSEFLVY